MQGSPGSRRHASGFCSGFVQATQKGTRVLEWCVPHPVNGSVDFVEISWGPAAVHGAARDSDIAAAPAIVHGEVSYGVLWDLSIPEDIGAVDQLLQHLGSSCECFRLAGQACPAELARLAISRGHSAEKQGRAFAIALSGEWRACRNTIMRKPLTVVLGVPSTQNPAAFRETVSLIAARSSAVSPGLWLVSSRRSPSTTLALCSAVLLESSVTFSPART